MHNTIPALQPSPEVLDNHRVQFAIDAPHAHDVTVSGDWTAAPRPLARDAAGVWSLSVGPLTPDYYTYAYTVDGVYTLDPLNTFLKPSSQRLENVFLIPGDEIAFAMTQNVPHGEVRQVWYDSPAVGTARRMHVYTPPVYDADNANAKAAYPVLYLLHGGGEDDAGWSAIGRAGFIMDNLLASGLATPMLVVMPHGTVDLPGLSIRGMDIDWRSPESVAKALPIMSKQHDIFVDDLLHTIIPTVEAKFRAIPDRESRAIAGLSMGGAHTLRAGLPNLDTFAYFGVFSVGMAGVHADFDRLTAQFYEHPEESNAKVRLFYLSAGDEDLLVGDGARRLDALLTERGIRHEFHETTGGHTWINWRRYLRDFAQRLFLDDKSIQ